jgi:CubicO group peptidase (beta-lactamase class C family)
MMLHEGGKLNIEDPIAAYLPDAITRGLHRLGGVDYSEKITIRHLLSHSSGLPDWLEDSPKNGVSLIERMLTEGDMTFMLEDAVSHVRDQLTPHFPPQDLAARRQKVRYSDTNFVLLVAIIEAVTGREHSDSVESQTLRALFHVVIWRTNASTGSAQASCLSS